MPRSLSDTVKRFLVRFILGENNRVLMMADDGGLHPPEDYEIQTPPRPLDSPPLSSTSPVAATPATSPLAVTPALAPAHTLFEDEDHNPHSKKDKKRKRKTQPPEDPGIQT